MRRPAYNNDRNDRDKDYVVSAPPKPKKAAVPLPDSIFVGTDKSGRDHILIREGSSWRYQGVSYGSIRLARESALRAISNTEGPGKVKLAPEVSK